MRSLTSRSLGGETWIVTSSVLEGERARRARESSVVIFGRDCDKWSEAVEVIRERVR